MRHWARPALAGVDAVDAGRPGGNTRSVILKTTGIALALVLGLLAAPVPAQAQRSATVPRIGYLVLSPLSPSPTAEREAFLQGFRDLGYVDGQNIVIEYRSAAWNRELLPDLADELVRLKVNVIVAVPGAIESAREATKTKALRLTIPPSLLLRADEVIR